MESGPLEGPGEAHGSVLLNDVGEGLLAFRAFPRLHGSVGPRIHTLNPRQTVKKARWLGGCWERATQGPSAVPGAITVGQIHVKQGSP